MLEYLRQEEMSNRAFSESQEKKKHPSRSAEHINIHFPDSDCSDDDDNDDDEISMHTLSRMSTTSNFTKGGKNMRNDRS